METKTVKQKGFLNFVERVGNKLPDPVLLFIIVSFFIIVLSWIGSLLGWSAIHPTTNDTISAFSLFSREGIAKIFVNFGPNIRTFTPLTDQMVVLLGLGLLEGTGFFSAFMRKFLIKAPKKYVTLVLVFIAVSSSVASDAGFLVLPPLAAMVFLATGRHPIAGLVAAYGSVAAGFSSSFFIGIVEVVGFGLAEASAKIVDPNIVIPITSNYYFTFLCSVFLPLSAFFVTLRFVEPKLGPYVPGEDAEPVEVGDISETENKALSIAGIVALVYVAVILAMVIPTNGLLRDPVTNGIISSPFMSSILLIVTGLFFFCGLVYGIKANLIKTHRDPIAMITKTYASLGGYILVSIFTSQLIKYFEWSNLGIISAITGANFLKSIGAPVFLTLIFTILFVILLNFFMPSHAGKLGFVAPVFVPLFMFMNVSPAATYLAYRIGDSVSNAITPMMAYFVILLGYAKKYKKDVGMGTLIANLLPYSIAFFIVYVGLFTIFYFFNLPIGPGAYFFLG